MPIGANALWIACHALTDGSVLVTQDNTRERERVDGQDLEDWVQQRCARLRPPGDG